MASKRPDKTGGGGSSQRKPLKKQTVAVNRKARHEFEILEEIEAGLVLRGTEVKVLREGRVSLDESFGRIYDDEVYLVGAHIDVYSHASVNHNPTRRRKLLLKRIEIRKLKSKVNQKGLTLVPLEVFFNHRGLAKIVIALGKGKRVHDKRQTLKAKDAKREMRGSMRGSMS